MTKCFFVEFTGNVRTETSVCECGCGEKFTQQFKELRRVDTGEIRWGWPNDFGPGAMYFAPPYTSWDNDSEYHLYAVCPDGHPWDIDSRASNCTMKEDKLHRCWVRHGEPPNVTVDKDGFTCNAGAGSIQTGSYHGFLKNGAFT